MIGTIVWALVAGAILGYLGKLLLPGRQDIPALGDHRRRRRGRR